MGEDVTADLINGLCGFKDAARWKVNFKLQQKEKCKENQSNGHVPNNTQEEAQEQEQQPHNPWISHQPRSFCQSLEQMTKLKDSSCNLKRNWSNKHLIMLNQMTQQEVSQIKSLQQKLRNNHNPVATPTDKVKPFRTASKSNCCKWAEDHLAKTAKEASRITLAEVKEQASQLLHDKVEPRILSDKEASFTKKMLNQMQRHHTADQRPTRFPTTNVPAGPAAPATNFTLTFPKTGYLGIKRIHESNRACYVSKTTIQASHFKDNLENQGITCNNSTTTSADAEDFCL